GVRRTTMGYDANNRLTSETISHPTEGTQSTTYTYDDANNRITGTVTRSFVCVNPSAADLSAPFQYASRSKS
ncbi:MAG: hypothetical protein RIS79_3224, partial [Verrucomicrobiota bacterium]